MDGVVERASGEKQKEQITRSLKILSEVFRECKAEYRVVGSVLVVAYKNKVFRHIHDLDIILDVASKDCVFPKLKAKDFIFYRKHWQHFEWIEAEKHNHMTMFFLIGDFTKDYFSYRFLKKCELRVSSQYLLPTSYTFNSVTFTGIPITSVIAGIRQAFLNPKRSLDKAVLSEENAKISPASTYGHIALYVENIRIPLIYDIFSFLYNIYGGIRIMLGKKYEVWE